MNILNDVSSRATASCLNLVWRNSRNCCAACNRKLIEFGLEQQPELLRSFGELLHRLNRPKVNVSSASLLKAEGVSNSFGRICKGILQNAGSPDHFWCSLDSKGLNIRLICK